MYVYMYMYMYMYTYIHICTQPPVEGPDRLDHVLELQSSFIISGVHKGVSSN